MVPISSWEPPEMCNDTKLQKISRSGPGLGHANSPFVFLKNNRILTQLLQLLFIGSGKIFYRNPNIWKGPHGHHSSGGGGGTKRIKQGWLEDKKNVWNESTAGLCDACLCLLLCEVLFVKPLISPRGLLPCDTATALGPGIAFTAHLSTELLRAAQLLPDKSRWATTKEPGMPEQVLSDSRPLFILNKHTPAEQGDAGCGLRKPVSKPLGVSATCPSRLCTRWHQTHSLVAVNKVAVLWNLTCASPLC